MPLNRSKTRVADKQSQLIQHYLQASLSNNTRQAYQNDLKQFIQWGGRIPSSPQRVALYLAENANRLSFATLSRRVVAIGKAHEVKNIPSPTHSVVVRDTLHGIRRLNGSVQRRVAPAMMSDIRTMVKGMEGLKGARDRALLLLGFAGAFRRSELVSITVEDVSFVAQGMIVHLKRGKTDQAGKGRDVAIPYMRGMCCPVKALLKWLAISEISNGVVFRRIDRHGNLLEQRLSPQSVALLVKQRIMAIGKNAELYSGHSLRAGWVTNAALSGASAWNICQHTGHKSEAVMHRYIRSGNLFMNYPRIRN